MPPAHLKAAEQWPRGSTGCASTTVRHAAAGVGRPAPFPAGEACSGLLGCPAAAASAVSLAAACLRRAAALRAGGGPLRLGLTERAARAAKGSSSEPELSDCPAAGPSLAGLASATGARPLAFLRAGEAGPLSSMGCSAAARLVRAGMCLSRSGGRLPGSLRACRAGKTWLLRAGERILWEPSPALRCFASFRGLRAAGSGCERGASSGPGCCPDSSSRGPCRRPGRAELPRHRWPAWASSWLA